MASFEDYDEFGNYIGADLESDEEEMDQQPYGQEAYQQPVGTNPAYYNNPTQPNAAYGNQGPAAYNPAQYGVTRGPTLPQEDIPTDHYGGYNGPEQSGYRDPRYPNGGPENVSTASRAVNEEYGRGPSMFS